MTKGAGPAGLEPWAKLLDYQLARATSALDVAADPGRRASPSERGRRRWPRMAMPSQPSDARGFANATGGLRGADHLLERPRRPPGRGRDVLCGHLPHGLKFFAGTRPAAIAEKIRALEAGVPLRVAVLTESELSPTIGRVRDAVEQWPGAELGRRYRRVRGASFPDPEPAGRVLREAGFRAVGSPDTSRPSLPVQVLDLRPALARRCPSGRRVPREARDDRSGKLVIFASQPRSQGVVRRLALSRTVAIATR